MARVDEGVRGERADALRQRIDVARPARLRDGLVASSGERVRRREVRRGRAVERVYHLLLLERRDRLPQPSLLVEQEAEAEERLAVLGTQRERAADLALGGIPFEELDEHVAEGLVRFG